MRRYRPAYPQEFRDQIVELYHSGRTTSELAREFEPTEPTIRPWVDKAGEPSKPRSGVETDREELRGCERRSQAPAERDILAKAAAWALARPTRSHRGIRVHERAPGRLPHRHDGPRPPGLAEGYYAWRDRPPSERAQRDAELSERIAASHAASDETYGAPRIHEDLKDEGFQVGRKRVARLMRENGLVGVSRRRGPTTTTRRAGDPKGPDLVQRAFTAETPNALWVADITYVRPARASSTSPSCSTSSAARSSAGPWPGTCGRSSCWPRSTWRWRSEASDVVHHSDHGCQYTSVGFGARCRAAGIRPSLGSIGDCYDNAMCESFFATLECELLDRRRFETKADARMGVFHFIEAWYNPRRRHSSLGYKSPAQYEQNHHETLAVSYSDCSMKRGHIRYAEQPAASRP